MIKQYARKDNAPRPPMPTAFNKNPRIRTADTLFRMLRYTTSRGLQSPRSVSGANDANARATIVTGFVKPRTSTATIALGILTGLYGGCASYSATQAELKYLETREIDRPYEVTYDGALNAIFSMGMTIQHSDKGSGVISGQSGDYAHQAGLKGKKRREYVVKKVTLLIRPRGRDSTQIRMKVLINEEQQLDRKLMTAIWQRIEREVLLDAPPSGRNARTPSAHSPLGTKG